MSGNTSTCDSEESPLVKVMSLPSAVNECSGIAILEDAFYTHNDGGDDPAIYVLDTLNKNISRKVILNDAKNIDWEDISLDGDYLYIGDIGDNTSNRSKNQLYKISLEAVNSGHITTDAFEKIDFSFRDKKGKKEKVNAEAMVTVDGTTYFLSKERKKTNLYTLSPGSDEAVYVRSYDIPYLITGLCKVSDTRYVASAYQKIGDNFYLSEGIEIILDAPGDWSKIEWNTLGLKLRAQCEGVEYQNGNLYFTTEGGTLHNGGLYKMKYQ
jgi:hypothetical protein